LAYLVVKTAGGDYGRFAANSQSLLLVTNQLTRMAQHGETTVKIANIVTPLLYELLSLR
jgi:hypothetical protein